MATAFVRRQLSPERIAEVAAVTANIPVSGEAAVRGAPTVPAELPPPIAGNAVVPGQLSNAAVSSASPKYVVGEVYEVPVAEISSNPVPPRAVYRTSAVQEMAATLKANGQRLSATGYLGPRGEITLIEGETRLRACRAGGIATLRVEIRPTPPSKRALYEEARAINVERNEQTALDDALCWKGLIAQGVYDNQKGLAGALGISEEIVSRTLSLASMPSRLISTVAEYPELLTLKMLNALREYHDAAGDDEALKLVFEVADKGLSSRDVTARRIAAQKGPVKRPRSNRESVTYQGAKGELRTFEGTGRVELVLKGLTPAAIDELAAKLKDVLTP